VLYHGVVQRVTVRGRTSSRVATHHDPRSHVAPGIERCAQAGIEPATGAWVTQQIGLARAGQIMSTQLHSGMCRPTGGLPSLHSQSLAAGEGDVRIK
jgi:hypothetical protein